MTAIRLPLVNLLPWRESRHLRRRRMFLVGVGAALVLALLLVAGAHRLFLSAVFKSEQRNSRLSADVALLQSRIDVQDEAQRALRQQQSDFASSRRLHAARIRQSRTLSTIPLTLLRGMVLSQLHYEPEALQLQGAALSAQQASRWVRLLEVRTDVASAELQALHLNAEAAAGNDRDYVYHIRLMLHEADLAITVPGSNQ